jgi:gamma-glutamyltranspeptidase/glutathione hydrolase
MHDFFRPGRAPLIARDAAIATSHPLATAAGLDILGSGGNAVDAALAAVSVQCVVEPHMTGIDGDGNAISFINSIFHGFGSGRVDPATGVLLHSRGSSFRVAPGHPNAIGPRKRPLHTIIPGLLRRDGAAVMPFGVMGGHYQAAGHAHFLSNLLDLRLDIQQAMDTPRFFAHGGALEVEPTIPEADLAELARRGHVLKPRKLPLGGSQVIWIDRGNATLAAGSDQRKDGFAAGF